MTTIESILSTRLAYNELLSRLEEYVRVKEREAAERVINSLINKPSNMTYEERKVIHVGRVRSGMNDSQCFYCEVQFFEGGNVFPTVDHIVPKGGGGLDIKNNRAPCCTRCNQSKAAMSLGEFRNHVLKSRNFSESDKKTIHRNITSIIQVIENEINRNIYWVGPDMTAHNVLNKNAKHIKSVYEPPKTDNDGK